MGTCLSSPIPRKIEPQSPPPPSFCGLEMASIITIDGRLRQYALPATASLVLQMLDESSSASASVSASSSSSFLCDSDNLRYDDFIPALKPEHSLHPDRIYFVLPASKLPYRLSATDMASLAVKATAALPPPPSSSSSSSSSSARSNHHNRNKKNKARISPAVQPESSTEFARSSPSEMKDQKGSDQKQQQQRQPPRYSSKRARMAVRSFRLRLSTIYEGSDSMGRSSRHHRLNSSSIINWDY